jgi:DNA-binding CsgD family transcriptional regulator
MISDRSAPTQTRDTLRSSWLKPNLSDVPQAMRRADLRLLPPKQRAVLRLLYLRGASQAELAAALGISRGALRRLVRRAISRATDPDNLAALRSWRRLTADEQRLVHLHGFFGISLREIARKGLVGGPAAPGAAAVPAPASPAPAALTRNEPTGACALSPACAAASLANLRTMLRRIRRKVRRSERRRLQCAAAAGACVSPAPSRRGQVSRPRRQDLQPQPGT